MNSICEVKECGYPLIAQGLCELHYRRLKRHGHLKQTRPEDWGKREKHPLYHTWMWMRRMRLKFAIVPEWDNFWQFVKDVGERPSPKHQLRRKDSQDGYGPTTVEWREVILDKDQALYMKEWRDSNPGKVKNTELRKRFGITLEDYSKMLDAQNGVCAICYKACVTGLALAVDHSHSTKKIRGLLCANCNKVLGHAKDSIEVLKQAIKYLELSGVVT